VSYHTYWLVKFSQRYDKPTTAKISSYVKYLKHAVEESFGGDDSIKKLALLRAFKEAADLKDVGECAAAHLIIF
jgi:hypothetical protein